MYVAMQVHPVHWMFRMSTLVDEPGNMRLYSGCMRAKVESSVAQPMSEPAQLYFEACFLGQSSTNWALESLCGPKMRPLEIFIFLGGGGAIILAYFVETIINIECKSLPLRICAMCTKYVCTIHWCGFINSTFMYYNNKIYKHISNKSFALYLKFRKAISRRDMYNINSIKPYNPYKKSVYLSLIFFCHHCF